MIKKLYTEYIAEQIDNSISYTEYLAEHIDNSISYTEYLAEALDKSAKCVVSGLTIMTYDLVADPGFNCGLPVTRSNIRKYINIAIDKSQVFDHLNADLAKWQTTTKFNQTPDNEEIILGTSAINGYTVIRINNEFFIKVPFVDEKNYLLSRFNYLSQINGSISDTLDRMYHYLNIDEINDVLNSLPENSHKELYINSAKTWEEINLNNSKKKLPTLISTGMSGTSGMPSMTDSTDQRQVQSTLSALSVSTSSVLIATKLAPTAFYQQHLEHKKPAKPIGVDDYETLKHPEIGKTYKGIDNYFYRLFRRILEKLFNKKEIQQKEEVYNYKEFSENFYKSLEEFKEFEKILMEPDRISQKIQN